METIEQILDYAERYQSTYQAKGLLDLIFLHRLWSDCEIGPDQPIEREKLQRRWKCSSQTVSRRLVYLVRHGLVRYDKGSSARPGYRFTHVGLPPGGVPLLRPIPRPRPKRKNNRPAVRKPAGSIGRAPKQRRK